MPLSSRTRGWAGVGLALLAGAVVWTLVACDQSGSATGRPSATLLSEYSVLGGPAASSDALPRNAGVSAADARAVSTGESTLKEWATATGDELCAVVGGSTLLAEGAPSTCNSAAHLRDNHELLVLGAGASNAAEAGTATEPEVIAGLAPNGVTSVTIELANGTSQTVPVVDNGFHLMNPGARPQRFSWKSASGVNYNQGK
jgi:hypothetical protein